MPSAGKYTRIAGINMTEMDMGDRWGISQLTLRYVKAI
jgi:hypothetical protein